MVAMECGRSGSKSCFCKSKDPSQSDTRLNFMGIYMYLKKLIQGNYTLTNWINFPGLIYGSRKGQRSLEVLVD